MITNKTDIRTRALELADAGGKNIAAVLVQEFGISRQSVNVALTKLVKAGELIPSGATRGRVYQLASTAEITKIYPREGLSEDQVWRETCAPIVSDLAENVRDIWHYGLTEMVNNAIDHSGSPDVSVIVTRNALNTKAWVLDRGEGIFLKIQRALHLYDPRESILELAKGKLTTDPENHTGEGIFFSSKLFDSYGIRSGNLYFQHDTDRPDMLVERPKESPGTLVYLELSNNSTRVTSDVFNVFAAPEEYTFAKTIVPVKLAQYEGEKLVSRSQAKRLTMRFERFQTVMLDFAGVETIGQAFADEVFRVFQVAHPAVHLMPFNTTEAVEGMIKRAHAAAADMQNR